MSQAQKRVYIYIGSLLKEDPRGRKEKDCEEGKKK
jgi:hypothetical protein